MLGKKKRLKRLFNGHDKIIILPMDHGFTEGPISGVENIGHTLTEISHCNKIDSVVLHRGTIINNYNILSDERLGLIMHLSGSTNIGETCLHKIRTGTVREAMSLGCDAVSVHINFGNEYESYMLEDISKISEECINNGMPLFVMAYVRSKTIDNELKLSHIKHVVRVADEIGADIVKVNYSVAGENFEEVVKSCQIPVVIAGGAQQNPVDLLKMIYEAMKCGAKGISIGRNIFQSDCKDRLLDDIYQIVHENAELDDILEKYIERKIIHFM